MPGLQEGLREPVPSTNKDELDEILRLQEVEQTWWGSQPVMETAEAIQKEVAGGRAHVVPHQGVGYKVSAKIKPEFRVLERNTFSLLKKVAENWLAELKRRNIDSADSFLVISSLARTSDYQKELIKKGYPASENSTHVKLGAFDIATRWFEQNRPDLLSALTQVIEELAVNDEINFIDEPTVGAYHIALNRLKFH